MLKGVLMLMRQLLRFGLLIRLQYRLQHHLQRGLQVGCAKIIGFVIATIWSPLIWAEEGYRYLHVTIDTPWAIFLFLLCIVLFPFVLMAILYWHFAFKKKQELADAKAQAETVSPD